MRWPWHADRRDVTAPAVSAADLTEDQKRSLDLAAREYREEIERRLRLLELQMIVFAREGGR